MSTGNADDAAFFASTQDFTSPRKLGAEPCLSKSLPISVFVDNQACIALPKNAVNSQKVRHFAIKLHFLQEKVEWKVLEVNSVQSKI